MANKLEIERKFRVSDFSPFMIPEDASVREIEQTYLTDDSGAERRVRKVITAGSTRFFYTTKKPAGKTGIRQEEELEISAEEYSLFLKERDLDSATIRKIRYTFEYMGHTFELDKYLEPVDWLVILEVELEDMNEMVHFPEHLGRRYVEVTGQKKYSNREIARGSLG
ncbi:MAG: hypothetical protein A2653_01395 [Candidatus Zambryskibacteria bacterium RIFCSPHIGHO2_01_FULL_43_25]|uniref:CYTH domain-containing protein n=1 Tax=Candidatus Zambryskibacteria bacterium RIFCSPLOWO2_01_FULL_45_21 TaxID=1802761 RepID=A0A1G2U3V2_9BACT|nr:MAG: hypothetical protein A2653_01395 [Candidatus Zambryskibacteria bacterium RIFCSPHIGHO2_01_FULL_43_25]OHB00390.1 MAG: hypothetical protein A3E94_01645 [Candidatus Zambryskibacteria bacterium RIFCSPHIGHO2_12_FULL_44_12b]OHB04185.1 MAG: hypothetical protein A3B14_02120 [Candidatus Zambryskibacteria bacterium RIFCSPLOWO2_01_FULL_45_21]